jgi:hypothetical protein
MAVDCTRRTFYGAPDVPPAEPVGAREYKPVVEVMGIPVVVNPAARVPHLWNGAQWTCFTCRQTSPCHRG